MSVQSTNPKYKLYYFNRRAVAEPIRYLFAYGGQDYEDIRIAASDWPELKPTMPMGTLPVLEVDGHRINQSLAIGRYVANHVGLIGDNKWENLQIDSVVETVNDLRLKIYDVYCEKDETVKATKMKTILLETIPFYLGKLDELAKENNGYLAVSKLTWADFFFAAYLELIKMFAGEDLLSKYPNLEKVAENVYSLDAIQEWRNNRPVTDL